jgi:hypothetical protein
MRCSTFMLAALTLGVGCGGPTAPAVQEITPSTPVDRVTIVSAQPPALSQLTRGTQVTFRYSFAYELVGGDTGAVVLVIQDQRNQSLMNGENQPTVPVTRGTGTRELSYAMTVPSSEDVTAINVFLPLVIGNQRSSTHMAIAHYTVR